MKRAVLVLFLVLIFSVSVTAHALEKQTIVRSDGDFNVQFSSNPQFPVTRKPVHFDFEVWDNSGTQLREQDFKINLQTSGVTSVLNAKQHQTHYSVQYEAKYEGVYAISPILNGENLNIKFEIFVDSFWPGAAVPIGIILVLLLILIKLMYKDCFVRGGRKK